MSPQWKGPPLPEETFTDRFGEGEGELLTLAYPKPLPMRLDRWLVSQRTEQSRPGFRSSSTPVGPRQRQDRQGQNPAPGR